ncbi:hypothetical protein [Pantoea rodasii]|nr:hypothetical protein [Pantoea rodasii]
MPHERGQFRSEIVTGAAADGHTSKTGDIVHICSVLARLAEDIAK